MRAPALNCCAFGYPGRDAMRFPAPSARARGTTARKARQMGASFYARGQEGNDETLRVSSRCLGAEVSPPEEAPRSRLWKAPRPATHGSRSFSLSVFFFFLFFSLSFSLSLFLSLSLSPSLSTSWRTGSWSCRCAPTCPRQTSRRRRQTVRTLRSRLPSTAGTAAM